MSIDEAIGWILISILTTGSIVGLVTWSWVKGTYEYSKVWKLDTWIVKNRWEPILTRQINEHYSEYIVINQANLPLIQHLMHQSVHYPDILMEPLIQAMINRDEGRIIGFKAEPPKIKE